MNDVSSLRLCRRYMTIKNSKTFRRERRGCEYTEHKDKISLYAEKSMQFCPKQPMP